jgi:hypothetical protein
MTIFPTAHIAKVLSQWEARETEARARVPCTRTVMISQLLRILFDTRSMLLM